MTLPRTPMRQEVWDAVLPRAGRHPVVVLSLSSLIPRTRKATVVLVTSTAGPATTSVPLTRDAGLRAGADSYVDTTEIATLPVSSLHRRRGMVTPAEMRRIEDGVRAVLSLP